MDTDANGTTITGRHALACQWIPSHTRRLLDAGCSSGIATLAYRRLCLECHGIDTDARSLRIAKANAGDIRFRLGSLDSLPYPDSYFDTVVCTDVLEHVDNEIRTLDELFRVLRPGGTAIITTPHRGLLTLADPYNYGYYLRRHAMPIYQALHRLLRGKPSGKCTPGYRHRHYTLGDMRRMLDASAFSGQYAIERVARTGLFVDVAAVNADYLMEHLLHGRARDVARAVARRIGGLDFGVRYGPLAANIAIKVRRLP